MLTRRHGSTFPHVAHHRFNRLVDSMLGDLARTSCDEDCVCAARFDLRDDGETFVAEFEVPGYAGSDIELSVEGDQLRVVATRTVGDDEVKGDATYLHRERTATRLARTLTLPTDVDSEGVGASLADGVLTVTLPKARAVRKRVIEVK